jgi:hypothetical protein
MSKTKLDRLCEIADINFGKYKSWDLGMLQELNVLRNRYLILNARHQKSLNSADMDGESE